MAFLDDDSVVGAVLESVPGKDAPATIAKLIAKGPAAISRLAGLLLEDGHGDDSKVRIAFHGVAIVAGRREADRKVFAEAVAMELEKAAPATVKMFLMQQIHVAGAVEAKGALEKLVEDPEVGVEAKRVLSGL
jgi:hypothetical protein